MSFLGDRLAEGVSCIPLEWHEEELAESDATISFDRAPQPPERPPGAPLGRISGGPPSEGEDQEEETASQSEDKEAPGAPSVPHDALFP